MRSCSPLLSRPLHATRQPLVTMDSEERTAVLWFMQGSCMVSFYSYTEGEGNRKRNLGTENLVLADLSYRQICSLVIYEPIPVHVSFLFI